ncbi:hypothetical protein O4160_14835 [Rhodococcus sp. IEGM 1401]|uniref:hypothetical protein n=1 Tax=unclassified Rhodococcus (in: high G+C Gram-positive bacteria) TaxID=192944 RepID=UPI0022B5C864|nr:MULTISPECIES: hypothetical protein [unclassified Rhodococcus (in: high G+C Gram-positive bacteria)]MCZ4562114.1 hypothetical protein [Rhodococcus sp. IEGM 1401]MDI9922170.1 hypothetical protein [Rhodococcus sp. IEGM 1372]MDV8034722.1 hypothetical protein [Rhodococcus sp. IEGM 1414]MDV8058065.1 hypothetical protein [Rhodococcus sp. IEGM 1343]
MTRWNETTKLVVAAVVTTLSVGAAVAVVAQDRSTTIKKITDSSDEAPGLAWAVDAADMGLEGATFASPRTGSMYAWGLGSIVIGGTALTLAVVSSESGNDEAVMVGIDTTDGTVLWKTPAPDLAACADEPLDGQLVCHQPTWGETPGYVTFDPATGESRNYPTDLDLFAVTVANDRVYTTSGDLEGNDVLLHRGTLENPSAEWAVPLHAWAGWEDDYATALKVGDDIGTFDVGGGFSTFDAATGRQLWKTDSLEDCLGAVGRTAGDLAIAAVQDCEGTSSNRKGRSPSVWTARSSHGRTVLSYNSLRWTSPPTRRSRSFSAIRPSIAPQVSNCGATTPCPMTFPETNSTSPARTPL